MLQKKFWLAIALLLTNIMCSVTAANTEPATTTPSIILIIDDMGNGEELGRRAVALSGPINYAFLPHSPHGKTLANLAHRHGKEIMLHLPMSNVNDYATGPGTLRPIMNRSEFLQTLHKNLDSIPHVTGVNNHMGSLLTQLQEPMNWLMDALKQRKLFFIDSRTSRLTVAEKLARSHQLPTGKRDIFLDNHLQPSLISTQFEQLITLAKQQGTAIGIAHPHPETLAFLEQAIPTLTSRGVQLVPASALLLRTPPFAPDCLPTMTNTTSGAVTVAKHSHC
jgi:polysaccharide deacetylase 2 family uncharacterized protein YibQ